MELHLSEKEKTLLVQIYRKGAVSRALLSKSSSLKSASLYRSVDSLLKQEFLLSKTDNESTTVAPGRPTDILCLNGKLGYSLAISLWRSCCNVALIDFAGVLCCEEEFSFNEISSSRMFNSYLQRAIEACLSASGEGAAALLGISVANVGLLDDEGERIVKLTHSQYTFIRQLRLPKMLRESYGVPVVIHNIVACAAIGYHTSHMKAQNMAYVFVGEGIATHTIVRDQSLYMKGRVTNGLGHMIVSLDGNKCECGAYGCLETYCSAQAMTKAVRSQLKLGLDSQLRSSMDCFTFKDICTAAQNNDPLCRSVIWQAAAVFCIGLGNLLKLLPMEELVFGGSVPNEAPFFFAQVQKTMSAQGWKGTLQRDRHMQENVFKGCHTLLLEHLLYGDKGQLHP